MTQRPTFVDDAAIDSLRPSVRSDAIVRHYGTEIVAWGSQSPAPVYLDPVASIALQLLDGSVSVAELIVDVREVLGVPDGVARNQLWRAVSLLDDGGLLETSEEPTSAAEDLDYFPAPPNP